MDADEVEALRKAYNKEHPREKPIPKSSHVWQDITKRLKDVCDEGTQACVVHALVKKPSAPSSWTNNGAEWLSSDDIDKSQEYYAEIVPNYYYVGSVPIDFDLHKDTGKCIVSSLCSLRIDELYKSGYRKVGIVFNTDPHDGPGEHWIAAFVDFRDRIRTPHMTYFDSYAEEPEPEIQKLMQRWKKQVDDMKIFKKPMELRYNSLRHQFKDAQCGMYCIYFLHCSLFNIPMDERVPDDIIMRMRPLFFKYKDRRS
jgi:hypothetical protein